MPDSLAKDYSTEAFLGKPVKVTKAYEALADIIRGRIISGKSVDYQLEV